MTVSGWTMARAERQSLQTRDRMSHIRRSAGVSFGRCFTERFKTLTWWRRARFSNSTAARERKADRKRVIKIGRTRIETELRGGGNLHHLREIGIFDRHSTLSRHSARRGATVESEHSNQGVFTPRSGRILRYDPCALCGLKRGS